jgi:Flp pilus assembly protein TadD
MLRWLLVLCAAMPAWSWAQSFSVCGDIDLGARDYRRMTRTERLHIEGAHFTRDVERLKRGKTGALGADIDYTLRHMPNNPRALMAIHKLGQKLKSERIAGATYPVGCYFERAARFAPDDARVHHLFGVYLLSKGDKDRAKERFEEAAKQAGDSPNLHYNLALGFLEVGDIEAARAHAKLAYQAGGQPPGLAEKLKKLGVWGEG